MLREVAVCHKDTRTHTHMCVWNKVVYWLKHYATSRKVADSKPDEVIELPSICLILPAVLGPGVYSASTRSETQS
jgi:hypothetical protein